MDSAAKIRIKVGSMELEYEGDPAFLSDGIERLLVTMSDLVGRVPEVPVTPAAPPAVVVNGEESYAASRDFNYSTNTIAAHIEAKSGPELVICALTQREIVQGKSASSRAEILAEMRSATTYFNEGYSKNLTANLASLTKQKRINQIAKDSYSLGATERKKVEGQVAEIG